MRNLPRLSTWYVALSIVLLPSVLTAQTLTIDSPSSDIRLASCDEYSHQVLGNSWDMNDTTDINNYIPSVDAANMTDMAFSGGNFSFVAETIDPHFQLLAPRICGASAVGGRWGHNFPIDTSKYDRLALRMYTDQPSYLQVLWHFGCDYHIDWTMTRQFQTRSGWHTYYIDMNDVQPTEGTAANWNARSATGIRIDPTGVSGANVIIDWVRLESSASGCGSTDIDYTVTDGGGNRLSLFVDDDSNPFNGYIRQVLKNASAVSGSQTVTTSGLPPGQYRVSGYLSTDYATVTQADPWDMDNSNDVLLTGGITSGKFSGGVYTGTTQGTDSAIYLRLDSQGIDLNTFDKLTIQNTQSSDDLMALFWDDGALLIDSATYDPNDDNIYEIDLTGVAGWSGTTTSLILRPAVSSGVLFSIDFVALQSDGFVTSITNPNVDIAPADIIVNDPPQIALLQPDAKGGEAFKSWEFSSPEEVLSATNLDLGEILPFNLINTRVGDFMHGRNVDGNADPVFYLTHPFIPDVPYLIDASRYKHLSWALSTPNVPTRVDVTYGSVARVIYRREADPIEILWSGDDIVNLVDGFGTSNWHEYTVDLTQLQVEGGGNFWNGTIDGLRIDPHEFTNQEEFYFDYARLRASDEANSSFAIIFELSDNDDLADGELYYNTTNTTTGGTLIGRIQEVRDSNVYLWDTSGVPSGTYYVYAVVNDGYNTTSRLATGEIVVDHGRAQDTTGPILEVEAPSAGLEFDDTLQFKGFALDGIQIATVEAHIDGELLASVQPDKFHLDARDAYTGSYPDAGNAGFDGFYDTSAIRTGDHSFTATAYDTAGNTTTVTFQITKRAGASLVEVNDPSPNGTPIPVSLVPTIDQTEAPTIRAFKYNRQGKMTFGIGEIGNTTCTHYVYVGENENSVTTQVKKINIQSKHMKTGVVKLTAKRIKAHRKKLPQFAIQIRKSCTGLLDNSSEIRLVTPKTRRGATKFKKLARKIKKRLKDKTKKK